jgi:hypothetical protein
VIVLAYLVVLGVPLLAVAAVVAAWLLRKDYLTEARIHAIIRR